MKKNGYAGVRRPKAIDAMLGDRQGGVAKNAQAYVHVPSIAGQVGRAGVEHKHGHFPSEIEGSGGGTFHHALYSTHAVSHYLTLH